MWPGSYEDDLTRSDSVLWNLEKKNILIFHLCIFPVSLSQPHCGNKEHCYITLTLLLPGTVTFGIKISRLRLWMGKR